MVESKILLFHNGDTPIIYVVDEIKVPVRPVDSGKQGEPINISTIIGAKRAHRLNDENNNYSRVTEDKALPKTGEKETKYGQFGVAFITSILGLLGLSRVRKQKED